MPVSNQKGTPRKTTLLALVSRLAREHTTAAGIERAARAELVSGAAQLIGTFRDAPVSEFEKPHIVRASR